MKKYFLLLVTAISILLTTSGCDAIKDVLDVLTPNNTITFEGTHYTVTTAGYGPNSGYCTGQIFLIIASNSAKGEVRVVITNYPNSNSSFAVLRPTGSCTTLTPFAHFLDPNGNGSSSTSGNITLNDNNNTFTISDVTLNSGKIISGKGNYK